MANRYLDASMGSYGKSKVDVQVDGAEWTCRKRMNDTNPFIECVMQNPTTWCGWFPERPRLDGSTVRRAA